HPGGAAAARDRAAAGDAGRGDRAHPRVRAGAAHLRRAHLQSLRGDQTAGVGGLPRAGHAVGTRQVPVHPVIYTLAAGPRAKWVVFLVWLVGIIIAVGPAQLPTKFADAEDNEST